MHHWVGTTFCILLVAKLNETRLRLLSLLFMIHGEKESLLPNGSMQRLEKMPWRRYAIISLLKDNV
jgi:hypothetical protein